MDWIEEELRRLKGENLYRERRLREGFLDVCSNDYLGLRDHPEVIEAVVRVVRDAGVGSGASQLVSGYTRYHRELEDALAEFKGTPSCVLFGSGYLANVGLLQALAGEGDLILSDRLNHASIIDGCRLSKADVMIFEHGDYQHLEALLRSNRKNYRRVLIVTDSVFSMDGDMANVQLLMDLCEKYECILVLDEAHATGTVGDKGRGSLEHFHLKWKEYVVMMGTLSKALGSYGAFVCASKRVCDLLVNRARSLIFSTAIPPALCAGAVTALQIIQRETWRLKRLRELSETLYKSLRGMGFEVMYHGTPILPIMVYSEERALRMSARLLEKGVLLQAIRYPTVPKGLARLRLTASVRYSEDDIKTLLRALDDVKAF